MSDLNVEHSTHSVQVSPIHNIPGKNHDFISVFDIRSMDLKSPLLFKAYAKLIAESEKGLCRVQNICAYRFIEIAKTFAEDDIDGTCCFTEDIECCAVHSQLKTARFFYPIPTNVFSGVVLYSDVYLNTLLEKNEFLASHRKKILKCIPLCIGPAARLSPKDLCVADASAIDSGIRLHVYVTAHVPVKVILCTQSTVTNIVPTEIICYS